VDTVTEKLKSFILFDELPSNGEEEIALEAKVKSWPFYKGGLYQGDTYMMILRIDETRLYNKRIVSVVEGAKKHILDWEKATGRNLHMSGLPWLQYRQCQQPSERNLPVRSALTLLVTIVIFFLFSKELHAPLPSLSSVVLHWGSVSHLGIMAMLWLRNYHISARSSRR
jgi:hypothetical protein